jgi:hypothetical protein
MALNPGDYERIMSLVKVLATGAATRAARGVPGERNAAPCPRQLMCCDSLCALAAAAAASRLLPRAAVRKLKEDRHPVCVSDKLYVGSVGVRPRRSGCVRACANNARRGTAHHALAALSATQAAHNREGLLAAGITHVLCVAVGLPCPYPADFKYATVEARACRASRNHVGRPRCRLPRLLRTPHASRLNAHTHARTHAC